MYAFAPTTKKRRPPKQPQQETIRDFTGGLNSLDSEFSASLNFASQLVNMESGLDGLMSIRQGTRLFVDINAQGATIGSIGRALSTTADSNAVNVKHTAHGLVSGQRITLSNMLNAQNGISPEDINQTHSIKVVDADNYTIYVPNNATATGDITEDIKYEHRNFGVVGRDIINMFWFQNRIICVLDDGSAASVDADRNVRIIWSNNIASSLQENSVALAADPLTTVLNSSLVTVNHPNHNIEVDDTFLLSNVTELNGIPVTSLNRRQSVHSVVDEDNFVFDAGVNATSSGSGGGSTILLQYSLLSAWSTTSFASGTVYGSKLYLANGVNKPIVVDFAVAPNVSPVMYLADPVTGTNVNVPIGKYIVAAGEWLTICGDPVNPDRLHVSGTGTPTTWYNDPETDATYVDLSKKASPQNPEIKGAAFHKSRLFVGFTDKLVPITMGIFSEDVHKPEPQEAIEGHGAYSHRSMLSFGDDLYSLDVVGVASIEKAIISDAFRGIRPSYLIEQDIQKALATLSEDQLEDEVFAIYNSSQSQYLLFIPVDDPRTGVHCFSNRRIREQRINSWAVFTGWNFQCGCVSGLRRVFLSTKDTGKIYILGDPNNVISADFVGDYSVEDGAGKAIDFAWEWPWTDNRNRLVIKSSKYLQFDTEGTAIYRAAWFVDRYHTKTSNGETYDYGVHRPPQLWMEFRGGDARGFGHGDQPYGGGRISSDERLFAFPSRYKLLKFRIDGSTKEPLGFAAISFIYASGTIRRV